MKKKKIIRYLMIFFIGLITFSSFNVYAGDCNAVLGSTSDPNSVAYILSKVLNYIKIIVPILIIVLSSIEFIKAIFGADDDSLNKAIKNLITRIVLAAIFFLIPMLTALMLDVFNLTTTQICPL